MKTVLITGAGGGMGQAAVQELKCRGYRVLALDIKPIAAEENVIPVCADITSNESILSAFEQVKAVTDHLDAIVHFAGIYMLDSLAEMEKNEFSRIFDINFQGVFLINRTFLPLLNRGSRIVITTSELAPLDPLPFTGIYAVTKAALDKYAYSLAMELQLLGIRVSVLRAGAVQTAALDRFCQNTKLYTCNARRFKNIVERVEARHIPPEKIAAKTRKILEKRNPRFAYHINRNPLLILLNILPKRLQLFIIRQILR